MQTKKTMTGIICGSATLADHTFVSEFESCRFPNDQFRHADHIRLAWIYIRRYDYDVAEQRMRQSIQRFAHNLGAGRKYHETLTVLWMRLVNTALQLSSRMDNFFDFARAHGWLLEKETVFEFYSRGHLMSDIARKIWFEPDRKPLPVLQSGSA